MTRMTLDAQGKRRLVIGLALVATLVAAWFAPEDEGSDARVDLAAPRAAPTGEQAADDRGQTAEERRAALAALDVDLIRKRDAGVAGDDAFARKSWYVPPPPPPPPKPQPAAPVVEAPPPPPPPPPMAPPLPFKHLGRMVEAGQALPKHYLMDGDRMIVVSEGDLIGGKYRFVGQIGNQLQFIYLPLNQRQNLPMSGAQ